MLARAAIAIVFSALGVPATHAQQTPLDISILYLERKIEHPPTLSNFETLPDDQGLAGARLALTDNATTGKFLKHKYGLTETVKAADEEIVEAAKVALDGGPKLAVLNMSAADLLAVADLPEAADDLLFNAGSYDVELRGESCRGNVLHTLPSRDMLADALMQFLVRKQWREVMLITGNYPSDLALGEAFRRSAKKFGVSLAADKEWLADADIRRNAMQEVPLFTQDADYDAVVVADEENQFAAFMEYNTWQPRPVMGSAGLMTLAWSPAMEQWAAIQLQDRFREFAQRRMNSIDYAAWLAVRSIGEAVTRTKSADVATLRSFLLSDKYVQDGFKGSGLSYRTWNGQMRQPIALATEDALVTLAPLDGFEHQLTELDTLGADQPETTCPGME